MSAVLRAPSGEITVGIGDLQLGRPPARTIVTHALGSCIGVFAWDPETQVGGCLHYMHPRSTEGGGGDPDKYADLGLPRLIKAVAPDREAARRLRIVACGGAQMNADNDLFRIGQRNAAALKQFLWHTGLVLSAHDLGGNVPRTARLDLRTGQVSVVSGTRNTVL